MREWVSSCAQQEGRQKEIISIAERAERQVDSEGSSNEERSIARDENC